MKRTSILILLALNAMSTWAMAGDKVVEKVVDNEKHLRTADLYNDIEHSKKCSVAFDQLREKLKVGMTSSEASQALGDAKWLESIHASQITMLAGWIPVDFVPERAFVMHLYPNANNWSNYVVYFSLSCPEVDRVAFTIKDFLQGKVKRDDVKVHQFALCHPGKAANDIGQTEVIPKPK